MKNQSTIRLMTVSGFQIIKMAPKHFSLSNFHQIPKSLESSLLKNNYFVLLSRHLLIQHNLKFFSYKILIIFTFVEA